MMRDKDDRNINQVSIGHEIHRLERESHEAHTDIIYNAEIIEGGEDER